MSLTEMRNQYEWKFAATLVNVETVCSAAVQVFNSFSLPGKDRFAVELLTREAVNNAFLHGCRQDPLLSFTCRLVISGQDVLIEVCDEGDGFDWRAKSNGLSANLRESGRGLSIYALYADSVNYNETGNRVSLTRIFNQGDRDDSNSSGQNRRSSHDLVG